MGKLHAAVWYGLVALSLGLLLISFAQGEAAPALCAFALAVLLRKDTERAPLPRFWRERKVVSRYAPRAPEDSSKT